MHNRRERKWRGGEGVASYRLAKTEQTLMLGRAETVVPDLRYMYWEAAIIDGLCCAHSKSVRADDVGCGVVMSRIRLVGGYHDRL